MIAKLLLASALAAGVTSCGSPPKPVKHAKKAPKNDGSSLRKEAREARDSGDFDLADKKYAEAYEQSKAFDVLDEYVHFLADNGRAQKAVDTAKPYYEANIADPHGYSLYGDALLAAENGSDALDVADKLLAINGEDADAHIIKGRALILLGKEEGLEELRKAVHLVGSARNQITLGKALFQLGKVDEAALAFRAAVKDEPESPEAHTYLGMALRGQSEYDEAKTHLEKAIDLDAKDGRAYFELGLIAGLQSKADDAEKALATAVKLSPNESQFWYAYGEVFRSTDRTDEAINAYKKAVDLDPPYPKAQQKLGRLLVDKKQYDDAEVVLTQAIRRDKNAPVNYLNLGLVYAAEKKNQLAIDNLEHFLQIAPKTDADRGKAKDTLNDLKHKK
jgi:tetratricopeptide (TPR) repeat protein